MYFHLVARLDPGGRRLRGAAAAALWASLRSGFPYAVAAILMPNHLHLVVALDDPKAGRALLVRILQRHTRRHRLGSWSVSPVRDPSPNLLHLRRQIRYVALNPCRARYTDDPLRWLWSTHRDVVGASADPWVSPKRLAAALGETVEGFAARHHAYVAGDPCVGDSPFPQAVPVVESNLDAIRHAACAALRYVGEDRRRRSLAAAVFTALARRVRFHGVDCLPTIGVSLATAYRWSHLVDPATLDAAALCLTDVRLRDPADADMNVSILRPPRTRRRTLAPDTSARPTPLP